MAKPLNKICTFLVWPKISFSPAGVFASRMWSRPASTKEGNLNNNDILKKDKEGNLNDDDILKKIKRVT